MGLEEKSPPNRRILFRISVCVAILVAGMAAMAGLARLKKPPAQVTPEERAFKVQAVRAVFEDVPVVLKGYGNVRAVDRVTLSAEVSGPVVEVHPRLDVGEIIPKGEVLFRIDPRDYAAAVREAEAGVSQWRHAIARLKEEYTQARRRHGPLLRSRDLAKAEFQRLSRLYKENKVGTRSGVEAAERAYNQAVDRLRILEQALSLYPLRIEEARSSLEAAQARLMRARVQLERCTVRAPFTGRLTAVSVEPGQFLSPGAPAVTLANDSHLEIQVALDSADARRWLLMDAPKSPEPVAWFQGLRHVPCRIRWTEDPDGPTWTGRLHRVVNYDRKTRTLTVAVRVPAREASKTSSTGLPLVEGMFCSVEIPGKTLRRVVRLPRWAVTFDNKVYLSVNRRLKTVPVRVARFQGDEAFIEKGIQEGDLVVVTRLASPLENLLLDVRVLGSADRGEAP